MNADRRARGLYWDAAWKLVEGCSKVSPGCDSCWSEAETRTRERHPHPDIALRARTVLGGMENGFCGRLLTRTDNLELPLRTKKPTVFAIWNDLFHEDLPDAFRDRAYAVMALCPQHTFLVLTKRAKWMAEYWEDVVRPLGRQGYIRSAIASSGCGDLAILQAKNRVTGLNWSLPNVWHGVTAENQQTANERIPYLLRVPGKRFLSIEPMLGPIDLMNLSGPGHCFYQCLRPIVNDNDSARGSVHAVLLGGESGKNARPLDREWVRSVREQCAEADIPFTFKQWGEYAPNWLNDDDGKEIPGSVWIDRMGKRSAGRTLDGVIHNNLPWDQQGESQ